MTFTKVKMCVRPDGVCLQGGCGYCDGGTFKTVKWLRQYAIRHGMLEKFQYGEQTQWPNRKKK